jgi:hypothetical protein
MTILVIDGYGGLPAVMMTTTKSHLGGGLPLLDRMSLHLQKVALSVPPLDQKADQRDQRADQKAEAGKMIGMHPLLDPVKIGMMLLLAVAPVAVVPGMMLRLGIMKLLAPLGRRKKNQKLDPDGGDLNLLRMRGCPQRGGLHLDERLLPLKTT